MALLRAAAVLLVVLGTGFAAPAPPADDGARAKPYIVTVAGPPSAVLPPGVRPRHLYLATIRGFAADLTPAQVRMLRRDPRVVAIEPDRRLRLLAQVPWGLDRIHQRRLPLDGRYVTTGTGAGATAYVVDSGVQISHPQFEGRARSFWDFEPANAGRDCLGHGTHVAGIIGARDYGVAKRVALRSVRVIGCGGYGVYSDIIAGVDRIGTATGLARSVVNLSLAGPKSAALDSALLRLQSRGAYVVTAAGNNDGDACAMSPAGGTGLLTVAASDRTDARAGFSNKGSCVELYAPGVEILSTYIGSATRLLSGTSMAAPHAAGVAALFKASPRGPSGTWDWLRTGATTGVIRNNPAGTPNRLLYIGPLS